MRPAIRLLSLGSVLFCALIGMLGTGETAYADSGPLSAIPSPVTIDGTGHASVTVANGSAVTLKVSLSLVRSDGTPVPEATVATGAASAPGTAAASVDGTIGPGGAIVVAFTVPTASAGSSLLVTVPPTPDMKGGAVLRVPLQTPPAVDSWTIKERFGLRNDGGDLPLKSACGSLGIGSPSTVGTVQADGVQVPIVARCKSNATQSVALQPKHVPWVGRTYKGKILLGPPGSPAVDLTLVVTTAWYLVASCIFIGILAAWWVGAWRGWRRAAAQLRRRTYLIEQLVSSANPHNADASFQQAAALAALPAPVRLSTIRGAVTDRLKEIRSTLRAMTSPTQQELADLRSGLDQLGTKVQSWPAAANLLAKMEHRFEGLAELVAYVQAARARTLDLVGARTLDEMDTIKSAAQEVIDLANDWPTDAIRRARELAAGLGADNPAVAQLDGVLDQLAAAADVAAAKDAIPLFWAADTALRQVVAAQAAAGPLEALNYAAVAAALPWSGFFAPAEVADPAATASGLAVRIFLVDNLVLMFILATALIAGMQALYVGKAFGGWWDLAAAVAWGAGSGIVAGPLSGAVSGAQESLMTFATDH